jgi:putative FmdB family regulatory protein
MPTYQYVCTDPACASRFELVQSFTDPNASEGPICAGPVRKVFSPVGVVFKGSGFYRNDSRKAVGNDTESSTKTEPSKTAAASGSSDSSSSSSKPAGKKSSGGDGSSSSGTSSNTKSTSSSSGTSSTAASA